MPRLPEIPAGPTEPVDALEKTVQFQGDPATLRATDKAGHSSKQNGRNRVAIAS